MIYFVFYFDIYEGGGFCEVTFWWLTDIVNFL